MKSKYYVVDICCLLLFQQVSADLNYRFLSVHFLKALSINVALPRRHLETVTLIFFIKMLRKNLLKLKTE